MEATGLPKDSRHLLIAEIGQEVIAREVHEEPVNLYPLDGTAEPAHRSGICSDRRIQEELVELDGGAAEKTEAGSLPDWISCDSWRAARIIALWREDDFHIAGFRSGLLR